MTIYIRENYPIFVAPNGPWDIWRNDVSACAAIPTAKAFKEGHLPSHFGTLEYAAHTLGTAFDIALHMRADRPVSGHSAEWHFFRSYVGTALGSSYDNSNDCGGEPLDANFDISDLAPATLESMLADCARFYDANKEHIHCDDAPLARDFEGSIAAREAAMAAHDFWLTRCGHGAGFWDGDWPEPAASALDTASKEFGNVDFYVGDDGQIYA